MLNSGLWETLERQECGTGCLVPLPATHALLHSLCCKDKFLTRLPFLWHLEGDQMFKLVFHEGNKVWNSYFCCLHSQYKFTRYPSHASVPDLKELSYYLLSLGLGGRWCPQKTGELEKAAKYAKYMKTDGEGKDDHHGFRQKCCLNSKVIVVVRIKEYIALAKMPDPFALGAVFWRTLCL